ncbi:uncharacterized protein LOC129614799 [Condylostylus longicornis]|uniref:uncharacterized protein LOC129614799 n=1 Tax=Condylostylus longicornis TaxID=2530218 RepID=UPI00244DDA1E|nr:uncharacterized protein LOC129614799 [Condylostylus longicornis]
MKLYILSVLISVVVARPSHEILGTTAYVLGTPIQSQYHSQDFLGQYAYGYNDGLSAKVESKSLNGITQGGYTYYDANGKLQSVSYIADAQNGFRATGTNFPKAQEVEIKPEPVELPIPVTETNEVHAARLEHLKAVEEIKNRNTQIEEQQQYQKSDEKLLLTLSKSMEKDELLQKKEADLKNINLLQGNQLAVPILKLESFSPQAVPLLPAIQLKSFANVNPVTFAAYPYGAANPNYGWSYGYTNLKPIYFNVKHF